MSWRVRAGSAPFSRFGRSLWLGTLIFSACRNEPDHRAPAPGSAQAELPPLSLRDDTRHLLLTWVDEQGDFHLAHAAKEVPESARAMVRVMFTDRDAGSGDLVYVADLRRPAADGTYPVRTMTRAEWDEVGASRRKARLEARAPEAVLPSSAATGSAPQGRSQPVILYGADWCKACRDAENYLRARGIEVVRKNIDQSPAAQAEMQDKLRRAGLPVTAQIPVLDLGGRIEVGFNPAAIERALSQARSGGSG